MSETGEPEAADDKRLTFYFDFISHNAYLAWRCAGPLCQRHGLTLEPVPVLFAGLLSAHGQRGPAEVEPKRDWMLANVIRKARDEGIPFAPPASHPFNPLSALRAVHACEAEARPALIDALFDATWARSRAVDTPEAVQAVATETGFDGAALVERASQDESKAALRSATDDALAAGVFGVPTMIVGGEHFFGYDDLPWLERVLSGDAAAMVTDADLAPYAKVRPSAKRKA